MIGRCACCKLPIAKPDEESSDICEECFDGCRETPYCFQLATVKTKKKKKKKPKESK